MSRDLENITHLEKPRAETKRKEVVSKETLNNYCKNNPLNLNLDQSISDEEYKKISDQILTRDKEIFEALS